MKAKDLLEKTKKATEKDELKNVPQEDKVAEAYENITKRLEAIRQGNIQSDDLKEPVEDEPVEDDETQAEKGPVQKPTGEPDVEEFPVEDEELGNDSDEEYKANDQRIDQIFPEEDQTDDFRDSLRHNLPAASDFLNRKSGDEEKVDMHEKEEVSAHEETEHEDISDQKNSGTEHGQTLDELASGETEENLTPERLKREYPQDEELSIPNLHSQKPSLNFHYRERMPRPEKKSSAGSLLVLGAVGVAVFAGVVYLLKNQPQSPKKTDPSPAIVAATVTSAPTPTPNPTLSPAERANFKIRVLNGTSKTGMAASVSAKLKELGYQTIKPANATNSAFARTLVRVKASGQTLAGQLVKDLLPDFDASLNLDLKETDAADGEVVLGTR